MALLAGCSGSDTDASADPEADTEAITAGAWANVSSGVTRKNNAGTGGTALLVYGGYGAAPAHSRAWANAIVAAKRDELDLGWLYAIKGPRDASYASREIGNHALAAELAQNAPTRIIVIAHSSGAYVANELLSDLDSDLLSQTSYYDLDGGTSGLTRATAAKLASLSFVYAHDPAVGLSRNGAFMQSSVGSYPGSKAVRVEAAGSGCRTSNCLHDALITSRPHNPQMFDVADDYTDFAGRSVRVSYLSL